MKTFIESVTLEAIDCGSCGATFALNAKFLENARRSKGGYTCPYCRTGWGWQKSEAEKLREQLEEKQSELTRARCETINERRLKETADSLAAESARKLARVTNGVCPCCNRTFKNLARHMATKHPKK